MVDAEIDFSAGAPVARDLDVRWIHGSPSARRDPGPRIQVHACAPHTFILRQSKAVSFEAPFMYLLCGNDRALLLDTGATRDPERFPLRETVDSVLADWLADHPRESYELVVAHSHAQATIGPETPSSPTAPRPPWSAPISRPCGRTSGSPNGRERSRPLTWAGGYWK